LGFEPTDLAPARPSEFDSEFHEAAHLLKYLSGLFDRESAESKRTGGFPDEPFEVLAHFGEGQKSFYRNLNQLKLNIKQLLDENQIDVQESTFADFLTEARGSFGTRGSLDSHRQSLFSQPDLAGENARLRDENIQLRRQLEAAGVTPYQTQQSPSDDGGKPLALVPMGYKLRGADYPTFANYYRPLEEIAVESKQNDLARDLEIQNQQDARLRVFEQRWHDLQERIRASSEETHRLLGEIDSSSQVRVEKRMFKEFGEVIDPTTNPSSLSPQRRARHGHELTVVRLEGLLDTIHNEFASTEITGGGQKRSRESIGSEASSRGPDGVSGLVSTVRQPSDSDSDSTTAPFEELIASVQEASPPLLRTSTDTQHILVQSEEPVQAQYAKKPRAKIVRPSIAPVEARESLPRNGQTRNTQISKLAKNSGRTSNPGSTQKTPISRRNSVANIKAPASSSKQSAVKPALSKTVSLPLNGDLKKR